MLIEYFLLYIKFFFRNNYDFNIFIYKDKKIMEKLKNLKISDDLHKEIKIYCAKEGLKINQWVEKQLQEKINKINEEK